jgi:hypothetical protein
LAKSVVDHADRPCRDVLASISSVGLGDPLGHSSIAETNFQHVPPVQLFKRDIGEKVRIVGKITIIKKLDTLVKNL